MGWRGSSPRPSPAGAPGPRPEIHAGGGSTVILGLIGLGLVVGWRSRTRVGAFLRDQMIAFLVFTALIGIVGMKIVDNYGHAGGAIAGATARLLPPPDRPDAREGPVAAVRRVGLGAGLLGCVGGQAYVARGNLRRGAPRSPGSARRSSRLREVDELDQCPVPPPAGLRTRRVRPLGRPAGGVGAPGRPDPGVRVRLVARLRAVPGVAHALRPPGRRAAPGRSGPAGVARRDRARSAPRLDPGLDDDSRAEVVDRRPRACTGPIDSRSLYGLRVVVDELARRARRDEAGLAESRRRRSIGPPVP